MTNKMSQEIPYDSTDPSDDEINGAANLVELIASSVVNQVNTMHTIYLNTLGDNRGDHHAEDVVELFLAIQDARTSIIDAVDNLWMEIRLSRLG